LHNLDTSIDIVANDINDLKQIGLLQYVFWIVQHSIRPDSTERIDRHFYPARTVNQ